MTEHICLIKNGEFVVLSCYFIWHASNVVSTHRHGLLVVHLLEVIQEAAPNLLDAFVDAILTKVTGVEIGDFPAQVLGILELLHGVEAHGVDQASRGLKAAGILVIDRVIHAGEAPNGIVNVAEHLATAAIGG